MVQNDYTLPFPFKDVQQVLNTIDKVDGMTSGLSSPITVRWLNKRNTFVNIGLEAINDSSCRLAANHNSFELKPGDIIEIGDEITREVEAWQKKTTPSPPATKS